LDAFTASQQLNRPDGATGNKMATGSMVDINLTIDDLIAAEGDLNSLFEGIPSAEIVAVEEVCEEEEEKAPSPVVHQNGHDVDEEEEDEVIDTKQKLLNGKRTEVDLENGKEDNVGAKKGKTVEITVEDEVEELERNLLNGDVANSKSEC
jgi:hypothetical protein